MMKKYNLERFTAIRSYQGISFSPNGQWVVYSANTTGRYNVWRQKVKYGKTGTPSKPQQLTDSSDSAILQPVWSPDGSRIVAAADFLGYELYQLYEISPDAGGLNPLTDSPEVRHELASRPFSPDGRFLTYAANERSPAEFDVVILDLETEERRTLLSGGANYIPDSWSPDGNYILAYRWDDLADSDLYLIDVRTGNVTHLTPHESPILYTPGPWDIDNAGLYLLTDEGREFRGLAFFDIESSQKRWVATPDWDVREVDLSPDGRYLAWVVNEHGYSTLYVRDTESGEDISYPDLPNGLIKKIRFAPETSILGLYISTPAEPSNLYMLNVATSEHGVLTQSFAGNVPSKEMVEPNLIQYPTFDRRIIPAFLYKPKNIPEGERVPLVLSIHGGPEAQELPGYESSMGLYQYLLHLGIGILAPNFRGSTGYGKTYQQLIKRDWGGGELKDLEYAVRYLQNLDWVDCDRLGVFGFSFGGFEALSCVSRLSCFGWKAAVSIAGSSNLLTMIEATPEFARRYMIENIGDPVKNAEMLRERSPLTHAYNITAPLLIIQGKNDPRVPETESQQIANTLRELNREVDYRVFEDEGHFFDTSLREVLQLSAAWFEKYLLNDR